MVKVSIFWFRRDLRLHDNAALYYALKESSNVLPIFIFDKNILDSLPKDDARVTFIHQELTNIQKELRAMDSDILCFYDDPIQVFKQLIQDYSQDYIIEKVYTNHDYEPYAQTRDGQIKDLLAESSIEFKTYKDQVIFEKDEILSDTGTCYSVFTPYSKKWKSKLTEDQLKPYPTEQCFDHFLKQKQADIPTLQSMNFTQSSIGIPSKEVDKDIINHYYEKRNFPSELSGTTRLGLHLRFGTISIRALAKTAKELNETFLNELIWRDFYHQILWFNPQVVKTAFKPQYDKIEWVNNEEHFQKWCQGMTGYPIVDAGMRQLNTTGYMHNRVRMIVASFLCKHFLIDWRWGEAYFAEKLLDFDLAANNGGWQWASGSGCDAAPYFRIFNPALQTEKFDKDYKYIRQYVPEFGTPLYPKPIIIHEEARKRCLEVYKAGLSTSV